jgi:hypothetical protein
MVNEKTRKEDEKTIAKDVLTITIVLVLCLLIITDGRIKK